MVDHIVLNAKASEFVEKKLKNAQSADSPSLLSVSAPGSTGGTRVVKPPHWLGWCLVSVGAVLVLHSLAMRRPG
jgi:hypothetical protein